MRDFNVQINKAILEDKPKTIVNEETTHAVRLADSIMEVFKKDGTDMLTAYMILSSLADSIYVTATFGNGDIV
jgi:hypothetical protein